MVWYVSWALVFTHDCLEQLPTIINSNNGFSIYNGHQNWLFDGRNFTITLHVHFYMVKQDIFSMNSFPVYPNMKTLKSRNATRNQLEVLLVFQIVLKVQLGLSLLLQLVYTTEVKISLLLQLIHTTQAGIPLLPQLTHTTVLFLKRHSCFWPSFILQWKLFGKWIKSIDNLNRCVVELSMKIMSVSLYSKIFCLSLLLSDTGNY